MLSGVLAKRKELRVGRGERRGVVGIGERMVAEGRDKPSFVICTIVSGKGWSFLFSLVSNVALWRMSLESKNDDLCEEGVW
jgi:hypothetical protein